MAFPHGVDYVTAIMRTMVDINKTHKRAKNFLCQVHGVLQGVRSIVSYEAVPDANA